MTVTRLDVGSFTAAAGIWRRGESMERAVRFPIPAYLIEAGGERILVDTGLHPDAVADKATHYDGAPSLEAFEFGQQQSVADQVDLETLDLVILTHLHFDHAGGLALLPPEVPVLLQRREWEAAHDPGAIARNFYLSRDYAPLTAGRLRLIDGDHRLDGAAPIRLLFTPGHTPGHQSVMLGEHLVIGGDVSHFASGLDDHRFPIFADDHAAQTRSAERLRELRETGVTVLPGHDPDLFRDGACPAWWASP